MDAYGRRRGLKTAVPEHESRGRCTAAELIGGAASMPERWVATLSSPTREASGLLAIPSKRHIPEPLHRVYQPIDVVQENNARYFNGRYASRGGTIAGKGLASPAVRASLDPTAPPPPAAAIRGLEQRRGYGSASEAAFRAREDHVDALLRCEPVLERPVTSSSSRARAVEMLQGSRGVKAALDSASVGGDAPAAGRRHYDEPYRRGDQAALLMLHKPTLLPSNFADDLNVRKGKAPVSMHSARAKDTVAALMVGESAASSGGGRPATAAVALRSPYAHHADEVTGSHRGARQLKYARDLVGHSGVITGTSSGTPVDDRPRGACDTVSARLKYGV